MVIVKVADVDPLAIWTDKGTVAFGVFDERLILEPPLGAAPARVTVPVTEVPPATALGEITMLDSAEG